MTQNERGDIEALLREFPSLARLEDGRVRCALTGHVMAPRVEAVQPYVRGKKYAAALAKDKHMESLKEFEPHIVRSKYCLLYTSPSPRDATLSRMPSSA